MPKVNFQNIVDPKLVAVYVAEPIINALKNGRSVFWLMPGGSASIIAVLASKLIPHELLGRLSISLTDERFGPVRHENSNWLKLKNAGLDLEALRVYPVLNGDDFESTIKTYNNLLMEKLSGADYKIGLFGIGEDGHTAGILPNSPDINSPEFAVGYVAGDYTRITMTAHAISKLDEAIAFAVGDAKWHALGKLRSEISVSDMPAQAIKKASKLTIFTDYKNI